MMLSFRRMALACAFCFIVVVTPAVAQDDCPPGHVRHPALTALDDASMQAAFTASFRGLFGREPSMKTGDGKDDGWYYIRASNHYGVYGDDQCHAGWSGYWESWLQVGHGDLALVQSPARFQPQPAPVVMPPPPVAIPPVISPPLPAIQTCDLTAVLSSLERLEHTLEAVNQNVTDGRAENRSFFRSVADNWRAIAKWGMTIVGGYVAGKKL